MKLNNCCCSAFLCTFLLTGCQVISSLPTLNFLSSRQSYEKMQDPFIGQQDSGRQDSQAARVVVGDLQPDNSDTSLPGPRPIERVAYAETTGVPASGIVRAVYSDDPADPNMQSDNAAPQVIRSIEGRGISAFLQGQPAPAANRAPALADAESFQELPTSALKRMETPLARKGRLSPAAEAAAMDARAAEIDDFHRFLDEEAAAELPLPSDQTPPQETGFSDNPFSQLDGFPADPSETQQTHTAPSFDAQFGAGADWRPAATRP